MTFDHRQHPRGGNPKNRGEFSENLRFESSIEVTSGDTDWPAHSKETVDWRQTYRQGSREDRMLRKIDVSLPPHISDLDFDADPSLVASMENAIQEIAVLDRSHGEDLRPLGTLLIRTESVASSKIEEIEADIKEYARALHGIKSNSSAVSMAAATRALQAMIDDVQDSGEITLESITAAHRALMKDDSNERAYAGVTRDMQNWIGGSDYSPRNAMYIPPPPETVDEYMNDLIVFCNRDDIPVLAQAAIAHAQFESIHPFTDGNGRIGRALVNSVLRRRGTTSEVVVPVASAIVARREWYFDLLGEYRSGKATPIVSAFAKASEISANESQKTAERLAEIPDEWAEKVGRVRRGSAVHKLLGNVATNPIVSADDASRLLPGVASSGVYLAIDRLADAGVLVPLTNRKRDQIWGAASILDELEDLGTRIAARASREM